MNFKSDLHYRSVPVSRTKTRFAKIDGRQFYISNSSFKILKNLEDFFSTKVKWWTRKKMRLVQTHPNFRIINHVIHFIHKLGWFCTNLDTCKFMVFSKIRYAFKLFLLNDYLKKNFVSLWIMNLILDPRTKLYRTGLITDS